MDANKALEELNDAADLVAMVEDLIRGQSLNPATAAGIKITLKSIRRTIVSSRDTLTSLLPEQASSTLELPKAREENIVPEAQAPVSDPKMDLTDPDRTFVLKRKDLRASIERIVERP